MPMVYLAKYICSRHLSHARSRTIPVVVATRGHPASQNKTSRHGPQQTVALHNEVLGIVEGWNQINPTKNRRPYKTKHENVAKIRRLVQVLKTKHGIPVQRMEVPLDIPRKKLGELLKDP